MRGDREASHLEAAHSRGRRFALKKVRRKKKNVLQHVTFEATRWGGRMWPERIITVRTCNVTYVVVIVDSMMITSVIRSTITAFLHRSKAVSQPCCRPLFRLGPRLKFRHNIAAATFSYYTIYQNISSTM